ncbi:MAG: DUF1343 domain-containing protein [Burkholderiales bacterium]|nr:DUF1343 domain-containing protein [Burkholderiales bacterium]MBL6879408.1 DUF1343 domain-containing protein [Burkholderiales bacterium]
MKFGLDRLRQEKKLHQQLIGHRLALLGHPASVDEDLRHALDVVAGIPDLELVAAFGPQHGLRGDKQDNMIESPEFLDPIHKIPVFSLYGDARRPTQAMMESFDVLLVDLQDLGCRIYTYITTLRYLLEACAKHKKKIWVLDRPNPIGRPVEGLLLKPGWESFVGAGELPMRHGLTIGELSRWFVDKYGLSVDLTVIEMEGWAPSRAPGFGWPLNERVWINPSPNAPNLSMARCYPGTVMLEGTCLSEGRGTTRPLEIFGAPDVSAKNLIERMQRIAPDWMMGCTLRSCWFEPTFHKYAGQLCEGVQIHVDDPSGYDHLQFRPWRLMCLVFKALKSLNAGYPMWRDFEYEYERDRLAIDFINGSSIMREWVENDAATMGDMESLALLDEQSWLNERRPYLIYE